MLNPPSPISFKTASIEWYLDVISSWGHIWQVPVRDAFLPGSLAPHPFLQVMEVAFNYFNVMEAETLLCVFSIYGGFIIHSCLLQSLFSTNGAGIFLLEFLSFRVIVLQTYLQNFLICPGNPAEAGYNLATAYSSMNTISSTILSRSCKTISLSQTISIPVPYNSVPFQISLRNLW